MRVALTVVTLATALSFPGSQAAESDDCAEYEVYEELMAASVDKPETFICGDGPTLCKVKAKRLIRSLEGLVESYESSVIITLHEQIDTICDTNLVELLQMETANKRTLLNNLKGQYPTEVSN